MSYLYRQVCQRHDVVSTSFLTWPSNLYVMILSKLTWRKQFPSRLQQAGGSFNLSKFTRRRSLLEFCLQRKSLLLRKKLQLTAGTPEKLPLNYLYDSPSPTSWWSLNICQLRRSEYPHLRRTCAWLWEWRSLCNRLFSIGLFSCALWCITIIMQAHRPIW